MGSDNTQDYGMNLPTAMVIASFTTIAWVNTIELQFRIWLGFKRYTGLYFWSLLLASWGCFFHPLGFVMLDFKIWTNAHLAGAVIGISWWCMVTGQALVLYSRLYLVVRNKRRIRWVLIMIITNFFILHIPITLLSQIVSVINPPYPLYYEGYSTLPSAPQWLNVYKIYEKVQMTGFTIQETIISGLYLWETRKVLRPGGVFQKKKTREVMYHLVWVNIFIIILDIALLATEYANLFTIQTVFKAAVYSIKLRLEFIVLNQLMDLVRGRSATFDLSNKQSNPHSSPRSVRLDTVGGRKVQNRLADDQDLIANTYSAFASKGGGHGVDTENVDGVLRTTEVVVHESPKSGHREPGIPPADDLYLSGGEHGEAITAPPGTHTRNRDKTSSPSSSEVEFAGQGA
ncbi:MAG: hypothetical protein Q9163_006317 [Psora crenata]